MEGLIQMTNQASRWLPRDRWVYRHPRSKTTPPPPAEGPLHTTQHRELSPRCLCWCTLWHTATHTAPLVSPWWHQPPETSKQSLHGTWSSAQALLGLCCCRHVRGAHGEPPCSSPPSVPSLSPGPGWQHGIGLSQAQGCHRDYFVVHSALHHQPFQMKRQQGKCNLPSTNTTVSQQINIITCSWEVQFQARRGKHLSVIYIFVRMSKKKQQMLWYQTERVTMTLAQQLILKVGTKCSDCCSKLKIWDTHYHA